MTGLRWYIIPGRRVVSGRSYHGCWEGGVRLSDVGGVLFSGSSGGTSLWFGDVGYVPMNC